MLTSTAISGFPHLVYLVTTSGLRVLGDIHDSKDDTEKSIHHFEKAIEIASSLNLDDQLFWVHYSLAELFFKEGKLDDAHARIERAKPHALNDPYDLGRAMELQARFWYKRRTLSDEAKSSRL